MQEIEGFGANLLTKCLDKMEKTKKCLPEGGEGNFLHSTTKYKRTVEVTTRKTFEKVTGLPGNCYKTFQRYSEEAFPMRFQILCVNLTSFHKARENQKYTGARNGPCFRKESYYYDPYYYTWSPFFNYVYMKTPGTFLEQDQEGDE